MTIKNLLAHSKLWFTLALLWTATVTFLCLVSMKELPSLVVSGLDKYVHFTFHFIFTMLWMFYVNSRKIIDDKSILKVVFASLIFGITIEILQELLTITRKADLKDVLANFTGAIIAAILFKYFYIKMFQRNT